MDKATKRELEAYPESSVIDNPQEDGRTIHNFFQRVRREGYTKGYHQAEKDNELTLEDMWEIWDIMNKVRNDFCDNPKIFDLKEVTPENIKRAFGKEALNRFKEHKSHD